MTEKTHTDEDGVLCFGDGSDVGPFYDSTKEDTFDPHIEKDGKLVSIKSIRANNPNLDKNKK